MSEHFGKMQ